MKWFKHDSLALKDEKIQSLINEYGACAYVIYFGLCELCSEKIDKNLDPSIKIDWHYAENLLHSKRSTIKKVLTSCATANLLDFENHEKLLICKIPNLLKRLDNWTSDLVVTSKKLPSIEEEQEVKNKKKEKEYPLFESLWNQYPSKDGKKIALKAFNSSVISEKDSIDIQTALKNYLASPRVANGYV